MASNTDTILSERSTTIRDATRPPKTRPPSGPRRTAVTWVAIIGAGMTVAALAVATFTGGHDADIPATRLTPQAEQYERQARLDGQAKTYGRDSGATNPSEGYRAARKAEAEQYERQAHLDGQAKTHGRGSGASNPSETANQAESGLTDGHPYGDEFVPGSRHMPMR
jgi:hypothetical protein